MAQEPHRDIHLPPQGAAPHAQRPKTEPHAVPLDEAAFRSLPRQDDSAVFTALADGAAAPAPHAEPGPAPAGGHPAFRDAAGRSALGGGRLQHGRASPAGVAGCA